MCMHDVCEPIRATIIVEVCLVFKGFFILKAKWEGDSTLQGVSGFCEALGFDEVRGPVEEHAQ